MTSPRYAVYFAPHRDTALWRAASSLIGRDAVGGAALPFPAIAPCAAADWAELTAEPRRYGFHATLKAPFELTDAADEAMLIAAARAFAVTQRRFTIADLVVRTLTSFVALVPDRPNDDVLSLGADCVVAFEPFRAPLSAHDRDRRLRTLTSPRQIEALERWGYPYVFEDFRFHMTLTGPLPEERREAVRAGLEAFLGDVARPLAVDAIALFRQDDRAAPFHFVERFPFGE